MKKIIKIGVAIILIIATYLFYASKQKNINIYNLETKEVYFSKNIKENDIIEYKWTHSFEHIPWIETFIVTDDNRLLLKEIQIAGYGAGIPETKGKFKKIENGMIVMEEINQYFEKIQWINSHTALNYIKLNGEIILKGSDLPHHKKIILQITGGKF